MLVDRERLAWAAGFYEGEGCFSTTSRITKRGRVIVTQKDPEPLIMFADIFPWAKLKIQERINPQAHVICVTNFEHIQALICMIYPWLSSRRKSRAIEILKLFQGAALNNSLKDKCPLGHPYNGENLIITKRGNRKCRQCTNASKRRKYHESKIKY